MRKFYEHQDSAYQATAQLIAVLAALVVGTVLLSGIVIAYLMAVWMVIQGGHPLEHGTSLLVCCGITSAICLCIVTIGSVLKTQDLSAGGKVIAEDLCGTLVTTTDDDADLRKLMNIVEEMSIASGIHVPPVYVLEGNDGINAFAAGYEVSDAVIGVTRGAIKTLNRDQLQGVIAHEFSHIFNGDMRLNMRMIGLLHGILCITIAAEMLMEAASDTIRMGKASIVLLVIGGALWPVGLIGTAISLLVKAATNRQREFLADAYAVQYTRNPEGLAAAMKLIAGHQSGSRVRAAKAIEASHMFFAEGCGRLASLLASHPPLTERILRLEPDWDGIPYFPDDQQLAPYQGAFAGSLGLVSQRHPHQATAGLLPAPVADTTLPGTLSAEALPWEADTLTSAETFLRDQVASLPDKLIRLTELPTGIPLILWGLWLANAADDQAGLACFSDADPRRLTTLIPRLGELNPSQQILLLDTVCARLSHVRDSQRQSLRLICEKLAALSEAENMFHWMWSVVLSKPLGLMTEDDSRQARYGRLEQVAGACEILLSNVCHAGTPHTAVAGFAFQRGMASMGLDNIGLRPADECDWDEFQMAIDVIAQLSAAPRRAILLACTAALTSDRHITAEESYVMRGVCQRLGYDVPCILPGQPLPAGT